MVSIIIPVHNGEKTILAALESVLLQYVNKELIVVDDFSTDKSMDIVKRFAENRNFNIIITSTAKERPEQTEPTGAPNVPRNVGASLASGEYIALLDQDDWWQRDKLALQLLAIHGVDICSTSFVSHNFNTGKERLHGKVTNKVVLVENMFERFLMLDKSRQTLMSTLMFRKEIYPEMDEYFGLTDFLWTAKLLKDHTVAVIERPLTYRGVSGDNASYKHRIRKITLYEQLMIMAFYSNLFNLDNSNKSIYGSYARHCYQQEKYIEARYNFLLAQKSIKVLAYYLTSFFPPLAKWISNRFCVWGDN